MEDYSDRVSPILIGKNTRLYRVLARGGNNEFFRSKGNNVHSLPYYHMVFPHCSSFHEDIQKGWILALDGDLDDHPNVECVDALFLSILELAESDQKSTQSIAC